MTTKRWLLLGAAALVVVSVLLVWGARRMEPRMRAEAEQALAQRLDSTVRLDTLNLRLFPSPAITGGGLEIRYQGRTDLPPLFAVREFRGRVSWMGLLRRRLSTIELDGLEVNIPPRRRADMPRLRGGGDGDSPARSFSIATLTSTNARLSVLPRDEGKDPRVFDIFSLRMTDLSFDEPSAFVASLTNPVPVGRIEVEGTLGPWGDEPAATPVTGTFQFDADLGTIKGIAGALTSSGQFEGPVDGIIATGTTDTPDFRIPKLEAQALPLKTTYRALVDGTSGDVQLEEVTATLGESTFVAKGFVVGTRGIRGKRVLLDVTSDNARMEDVLNLTVRSQPAPMTGALALTTSLDLPQGEADVVDKLRLAGTVTVSRARFTSDTVQDKVDDLSRRASGRPEDTSLDDVTSDITAAFTLDQGVMTFTDVAYRVQGAAIALAGTYGLEARTLNFAGTAHLVATVSETQTGFRHFLLKVFDPLFRKGGAGTRLALTVTGTIDEPKIGLALGRTLKGK